VLENDRSIIGKKQQVNTIDEMYQKYGIFKLYCSLNSLVHIVLNTLIYQ